MRDGPRGFRPGFPCPAVLRNSRSEAVKFRLRGRYPLRRAVPCTSPTKALCNSPTRRQTDQLEPYNPRVTTTAVLTSREFGLFPFRSPLLRESRFLSFPPVTKMFQFTGLPLPALCIQAGVRAHYHWRVSPFGNPGVKGWSAPNPGLSQPPTSFFGSWRQGIHRVPLFS